MDESQYEETASILTPSQRDFLRKESGEEEYEEEEPSASAKRAMRSRIRNRVKAALLDFRLLREHLDLSDLERAFEPLDDFEEKKTERFATDEVGSAVSDLIAVIFLVEEQRRRDEANIETSSKLLAGKVEAGIKRALTRLGVAHEGVTVDIEIKTLGPMVDLAQGELARLSSNVLADLHIQGEISDEEFSQAIQKKREMESSESERNE